MEAGLGLWLLTALAVSALAACLYLALTQEEVGWGNPPWQLAVAVGIEITFLVVLLACWLVPALYYASKFH